MKKIIIRDETHISPFCEPARELRVMNKPLWLYQRDVLSSYCNEEVDCESLEAISSLPQYFLTGELLVYRDNLFFDEFLFKEFITSARQSGKAAQIAFSKDDKAIATHAIYVQDGIRLKGEVYVADLFYYPDGSKFDSDVPQPLVVDTQAQYMGYYRVPAYMTPTALKKDTVGSAENEATPEGDLGFYVPLRAFLSIESWVHLFVANSPFGIFAYGARTEKSLENISVMFKVLWRSLLERKQFLSSSALVVVGENTRIDPSAIIQGPTIIGNNVTIEAGTIINACVIGDNVNIMQGSNLLLSVVGDGSYLGFRAALFMTTLMENSIVAQNTCLQLAVVGRNTFVGAGSTFTDFKLIIKPLSVWHKGELRPTNMNVLGGCVGHNCRIGSGHIVYPCRTIESDVIYWAKPGQTIISRNLTYADSDHHNYPSVGHHPQYHADNWSDRQHNHNNENSDNMEPVQTGVHLSPKT